MEIAPRISVIDIINTFRCLHIPLLLLCAYGLRTERDRVGFKLPAVFENGQTPRGFVDNDAIDGGAFAQCSAVSIKPEEQDRASDNCSNTTGRNRKARGSRSRSLSHVRFQELHSIGCVSGT